MDFKQLMSSIFNDNINTDANMDKDLLKRIESLVKRVDNLETRVQKLENTKVKVASASTVASVSAPKETNDGKVGLQGEYSIRLDVYKRNENGERIFNLTWLEEHIKDSKETIRNYILHNDNYGPYIYSSFYKSLYVLTDGQIKCWSRYFGNTLREVKMVADLVGYPYDNKIRKENLAAELIQKYGANGSAVINSHLLKSNGQVFLLSEPVGIISETINVLTSDDVIKEYDIKDPFKVDTSWSDAETWKAICVYAKGLKKRYNDDFRKDAERYDAWCEEYKKKKENK